ncbi:SGNH/GDSL hydrolase family protein [Sphingobium sp. HBC34]|uniref:SGNH/GDSL hydrolase family protein n=1 Tax=Sphingobium cyanobacteriorum TaxID=3063954 RepID=A0ABT8ZKW0_9SPHN|nr:SGNH/GDSL hydrolase family protein [Sphingobium sp. HBC34]MDO7834846.1 SGNH/GDSL hydrolase family protein [Sphingobium sp. HBC34]
MTGMAAGPVDFAMCGRQRMNGQYRATMMAALWPVLLLAGCATAPVAPSTRYVALGSSFAAGPGITVSADDPANRCTRSRDNYAHQLARLRHLDLVDVSCGGATTAHLLGPWNELAPQLDALTPDTALVTITIGGNDVGFVGYLFAQSCKTVQERPDLEQASAMCRGMAARQPAGPAPAAPTQAIWAKLDADLDRVVAQVRTRAPRARLIFVDYVSLLPTGAPCSQVPLSMDALATARATADRLAGITATVAQRNGAEVLRASDLSRGHDACAAEPWSNGLVARPGVDPFTPYHPNLAGMTAIATALDDLLRR